MRGRQDPNSVPDAEHTSIARTALYRMLLRNDGRRILLFGAWPASARWPTVRAKLWAQQNTSLELSCVKGRLERLAVVPAERRRDVVFLGEHCRPSLG